MNCIFKVLIEASCNTARNVKWHMLLQKLHFTLSVHTVRTHIKVGALFRCSAFTENYSAWEVVKGPFRVVIGMGIEHSTLVLKVSLWMLVDEGT